VGGGVTGATAVEEAGTVVAGAGAEDTGAEAVAAA